jgi:flagellar M-ring protein FliF
MEKQQQIERDLTTKVVSLLEPVVGQEGVRVNISVRLDPQSEEATEEKWDPATQAIRSRQVTGDGATLAASAQGLAGARANLPAPVPANAGAQATPPVPAPTPAASPVVHGSETTNYEISKVVRHTIRPRGEIARLSVAVILDNESIVTKNADGSSARTMKPRKPEELQKIQSIVAAAVGLDPARGDQLTIENVPFEELVVDEAPKPTVWQRLAPQAYGSSRLIAVVVLGALAFFMFVRPLMRRATVTAVPVEPPELGEGRPRTVGDLEGDLEAQIEATLAQRSSEHVKLPVLTRRLGTLATKEPEHAARLLRMWMSQENR